MPLQKSNTESKQVSKRVLQTKKEIEQLKSELQKLINRGINPTENVSSNNVPNIKTKSPSETQCQISKDNLHDGTTTTNTADLQNRKNILLIPKNGPTTVISRSSCFNKTEKKSEIPKKERHYNVEEAREYIKKQKEKRMGILKSQGKQSQNTIDMRKEKLKELQAKSLELVKKNINKKREKSKSRENLKHKTVTSINTAKPIESKKVEEDLLPLSNNHFDANGCLVPDLIVNNINHTSKNNTPMITQHLNKNTNDTRKIHPNLQNVTIRTDDFNLDAIPKLQLPSIAQRCYDLQHCDASVKIQALYRGYRQRKIYKATIKMKRQSEENARKLAKDVLKRDRREKQAVNLLRADCRNEVPFWLETITKPYPYSFISAVKRKLNFTVNAPSKTYSDVAIQSSINEPPFVTPRAKSEQEIKILLEDSLKAPSNNSCTSFLSHKRLNLNLRNIEALQLDIKSDVNGCDIEEKSYVTKTKSSKSNTNILESSGSDTSKNIPDICSESMDDVYSSNTDLSDSNTNLKINIDRLKSFKLKEKSHNELLNNIHVQNNPNEDIFNLNNLLEKNEITNFGNYIDSQNASSLKSSNHFRSKSASEILERLENLGSRTSHNLQNGEVIVSGNRSKISKSKASSVREQDSSFSFDKNSGLINKITLNDLPKHHHSRSKSASNVLVQHLETLDNKILHDTNESKATIYQEHISQTDNKLVQSDKETLKLSNHSTSNNSNHEILRSALDYVVNLDDSKILESFKSLLHTAPKSTESIKTSVSSKDSGDREVNYSTNFSNSLSSVPSLKRPTDRLTTSQHSVDINSEKHKLEKKVIAIQPGEVTCYETKTNTNQIHLKFEAELHLLNDFNESLRQFMAVEKSLLELQTKNQSNTTIYHHQDTQTSAPFPSAIQKTESVQTVNSQSSQKAIPTINYSRGSEATENLTAFGLGDSFLQMEDTTFITNGGIELTQIDESLNSTSNETNCSNLLQESYNFGGTMFAGLSLGMFDQLIKDEDSRIENLKTILKIREKALLDRTKGELAWLEIQKKQLIETGQLHEASQLKKKQRGIVIKLQHEKQEMQRLKQMQKAASKERKIILKEQRNMIKAQLSSGNIVAKIKRNMQKDRQRSGPVKVYNLHRETVNTETSISKRNSAAEELIITSHSESTISRISDCATDPENVHRTSGMQKNFSHKTEHAKRFLLMKEAALQKRRKAAEDLLQWHQRLLEEERKIAELEMAANTIINQVPNATVDNAKNSSKEKYVGNSQLNPLWLNMKGREQKLKAVDDTAPLALEQICKDSKKCVKRNKNLNNNNTVNDNLTNRVDNKSSDLSDIIHTETLSGADSNTSLKSENSGRNIKGSTNQIENSFDTANSSSNKSITNHSNISYSSQFESQEIAEEIVESSNSRGSEKENAKLSTSPVRTQVLENEIDKSKSTLHEIMQNISNITDEISTIYKLSFANSGTNESPIKDSINIIDTKSLTDSKSRINSFNTSQNDISNKQSTERESNNLQSEIVKSLSELIKTQSPCQDIRSLRERNIIETPEVVEPKNKLNESQNTLTSCSELQTNSLKVETEENSESENKNLENNKLTSDISQITLYATKESDKDDEIVDNFNLEIENNEQSSVDGEKEDAHTEMVSLVQSRAKDIKQINDEYQNENTIFSELSSFSDNTEPDNNIINDERLCEKWKHSISIDSNNSPTDSAKSVQVILDLSYGFVPCKNKSIANSEHTSISDEIQVEQYTHNTDKTKTDSPRSISELLNKHTSVELNSEENIKNLNKTIETTENLSSKSENNQNLPPTASNKDITETSKSISCSSVEKQIIEDRETEDADYIKFISAKSSVNESVASESEPISNYISHLIENELVKLNIDAIDSTLDEKDADNFIAIDSSVNETKIIEQEDISNENSAPLLHTVEHEDTNVHEVDEINCANSCSDDEAVVTNLENSDENNGTNYVVELISEKEFAESVKTDGEEGKTISSKSLPSESVEINEGNKDLSNTEQTTTKIEELEEEIEENSVSKSEFANNKNSLADTIIDVKKRVSEILADAHNSSREDKSPRLQDIYTTTYDIITPDHSPEIGSPVDPEHGLITATQLFGEEAEALFKKQLAIEQEIKQLEQQQKEQIPYLYLREIPNKPPPPYTPPSTQFQGANGVLPLNVEQLDMLTENISEVLYEAYNNGYLQSAQVVENKLPRFSSTTDIDKECYEFVFDLCKELAIDHYKQFTEDSRPSWLKIIKKSQLAKNKPYSKLGLKQYLDKKVKEFLGFEKVEFKENVIIKWSRKKRDHVDELLVLESQTEESEWTNYDEDEIIVKNEVTNEIMNVLLQETANVMSKILRKKTFLY